MLIRATSLVVMVGMGGLLVLGSMALCQGGRQSRMTFAERGWPGGHAAFPAIFRWLGKTDGRGARDVNLRIGVFHHERLPVERAAHVFVSCASTAARASRKAKSAAINAAFASASPRTTLRSWMPSRQRRYQSAAS